MPDSAEDHDLQLLIQNLSAANPSTRTRAAAAIFRLGYESARAITTAWLEDHNFAECVRMDETGAPLATIGVAVERGTFEKIRTANSSPALARVPDDQDAEEFELDFPDGVRLDILTTKRPDARGAIDKFLRKFGEGIQQVEFEVRNVDRATEILRSKFSIVSVYPQSRAGANGSRVNFFLASGPAGKVLIELVELW